MNPIIRTALICCLALAGTGYAQTKQTVPPDNTKTNAQDRTNGLPTADQQKGTKADLDITTQIRKLLTADKSLSTNAKNVKVITENGTVTLRGPVASEDEKKSVEAKATEVAGATHVKSELQVAARTSEKSKSK